MKTGIRMHRLIKTYTERLRSSLIALISIFLRPILISYQETSRLLRQNSSQKRSSPGTPKSPALLRGIRTRPRAMRRENSIQSSAKMKEASTRLKRIGSEGVSRFQNCTRRGSQGIKRTIVGRLARTHVPDRVPFTWLLVWLCDEQQKRVERA